METVVLVIHLMLALSIIGLVLLQRSEGGGLGIGGSGGMGGLATPQATANVLTRATAVCAGCFFATSLILGILAGTHTGSKSILSQVENVPAAAEEIIDEAPLDPVVPISE
jgi:preprotein translocase subunit SecG